MPEGLIVAFVLIGICVGELRSAVGCRGHRQGSADVVECPLGLHFVEAEPFSLIRLGCFFWWHHYLMRWIASRCQGEGGDVYRHLKNESLKIRVWWRNLVVLMINANAAKEMDSALVVIHDAPR